MTINSMEIHSRNITAIVEKRVTLHDAIIFHIGLDLGDGIEHSIGIETAMDILSVLSEAVRLGLLWEHDPLAEPRIVTPPDTSTSTSTEAS